MITKRRDTFLISDDMISDELYYTDARFCHKGVILASNVTNPTHFFFYRFQYISAERDKMYWNLIWKVPIFVKFSLSDTLLANQTSLLKYFRWHWTPSFFSVVSVNNFNLCYLFAQHKIINKVCVKKRLKIFIKYKFHNCIFKI